MRIIALSGPKYSGKDTAAKGLFDLNREKNYFRRAPMAEGVKNIVWEMFGIPFEVMEDPILKEQLHEPSGLIPRWPMMDIANWLRGKYGGDVHARRWERIALESPGWGCHVVTDMRFPEEIDMFRKHDAALVYISNPEAEAKLAEAQSAGDAMALNQSESHYDMLKREAKYTIINDRSVGHLQMELMSICQQHYGHWNYWEGVERNVLQKIRMGEI